MTFESYGCVKVQKIKDIADNEMHILRVKPLKSFMGTSESCILTGNLAAFDKIEFEGNTILIKISEQNGKNRYVYIGGDMICFFQTNDNN